MAVERGLWRGEGVQLSRAKKPQRAGWRTARPPCAPCEDQPVTPGEQRMHRVDVKYGCKRDQDVRDREVAAEVTEPGPVDHVQVVAADAVGHLRKTGVASAGASCASCVRMAAKREPLPVGFQNSVTSPDLGF
jgi:hypothetical protein